MGMESNAPIELVMNKSLLGSWCFVFLLKRSGALAEKGLNLQAPSLCVVFGSQDRGLPAVPGLEEAVLSPRDPYRCDEDMPLPPKCHSLPFPNPQLFQRVRNLGEEAETHPGGYLGCPPNPCQ